MHPASACQTSLAQPRSHSTIVPSLHRQRIVDSAHTGWRRGRSRNRSELPHKQDCGRRRSVCSIAHPSPRRRRIVWSYSIHPAPGSLPKMALAPKGACLLSHTSRDHPSCRRGASSTRRSAIGRARRNDTTASPRCPRRAVAEATQERFAPREVSSKYDCTVSASHSIGIASAKERSDPPNRTIGVVAFRSRSLRRRQQDIPESALDRSDRHQKLSIHPPHRLCLAA